MLALVVGLGIGHFLGRKNLFPLVPVKNLRILTKHLCRYCVSRLKWKSSLVYIFVRNTKSTCYLSFFHKTKSVFEVLGTFMVISSVVRIKLCAVGTCICFTGNPLFIGTRSE